MTWLAFAAAVGAIAVGIAAYMRWGQTGGTLRDALAVIRAGFFILVGVGLIAGGFVIIGAFVIALFVFIGAGAAKSTRDGLRERIAGE